MKKKQQSIWQRYKKNHRRILEQLYVNKLDPRRNGQISRNMQPPRPYHEEIDNLNGPINNSEIEFVIKKKKTSNKSAQDRTASQRNSTKQK